ncbi:fructokinase [Anaerolinea thermolimosa]|uniref:ROK family protein n=1 Tax=Anaerolinea thermolimosa TaxID=229919 RepID=UPI00078297D6|nr:ROK family protein [Anaerolinea thermolimosa]GAP06584.1 fructokinase [Anaerolinea thermolimosa]
MAKLVGGIEAGGTKFVCLVGSSPDDIRAEIRFPTTHPQETLTKAVQFFKEQEEKLGEKIEAIGVACFGPIDLNPSSPTYGYITTTPKPGWAHTPVVKPLHQMLGVPVAFDHDVVVAGIGEGKWGAAQGLKDFIYLTIGTGIGGGVIISGKPVHGLVHPEIGHIRIPHDLQKDPFPGACPYHGDCFEGLASGPAIEKRWGKPGHQLPVEHPAWEIEAEYLSLAVYNLILTLSPEMVILGGGVMQQLQLFPRIRQRVLALLNQYIQSPAILENIDSYIVPPSLGNRSGGLGAIAIAQQIIE